MNTARQLQITISPAGKTTVDAQGYTGSQCEEASKHIEVVLGSRGSKKKKPEFFQPSNTAATSKLKF